MTRTQIVIPCYNESESLDNLIQECRKVVEASKNEVHFLIVDNGSTDSTEDIINSKVGLFFGIEFLRVFPNQGYGGGIISGLEKSTAEIVGWTHADLQTPLMDCLSAVRLLKDGNVLAKGKRTGRPVLDRVFSKCMGVFESILFAAPLVEINAQPTVFTRDFYSKWGNVPTDFSIDLYALVMSHQLGVPVVRFGVEFSPRRFGNSKWNFGFTSRIRFIERTIKYSLSLRQDLK